MPVRPVCRTTGRTHDAMGNFLFLFFFAFFFALTLSPLLGIPEIPNFRPLVGPTNSDFVPQVFGDPRECRGDVVMRRSSYAICQGMKPPPPPGPFPPPFLAAPLPPRTQPPPPSPPRPESGPRVGGSRRMARCYGPPVVPGSIALCWGKLLSPPCTCFCGMPREVRRTCAPLLSSFATKASH